jgi:transglutaminase/protease-like cytokinesis protein 3
MFSPGYFQYYSVVMKKWVCILVIFSANWLSAQHAVFASDCRLSASPIELLSRELVAHSTSDMHKVRSIFRWITDNISYQVRPAFTSSYAKRYYKEEEEDSVFGYSSLDERIAASVIRKREAVCDGYARLFKTLCDYAGIRAEVVLGYARTSGGRGAQFRSNHKWNAVFLDGKWQLLDATWASGFISFSGDFIRHYDDFYFLTPPDQFIRDHYPEDLFWTLLQEPPAIKEFSRSPFRYSGFAKKRIVSFKPASGVIEAAAGDTLLFEVEAFDEHKNLWITDSAIIDTAEISVFASWPKTKNIVKGDKAYYSYVVPPTPSTWLYLVYNEENVLRYKLDVRKPAAMAGK